MNQLAFMPLSLVNPDALAPLLDEEAEAWLAELDWDYAPIRNILGSFLRQNLLPGFAAMSRGRAVSYSYFLTHRGKAILGSFFTSRAGDSLVAGEEVLRQTVARMKELHGIDRIEAQVIPFSGVNPMAVFAREGFQSFARYFMELDLRPWSPRLAEPEEWRIVPWDSACLSEIASVVVESYMGEYDAQICDDYRSVGACTNYLRSLTENPGCGTFLPGASLLAIDPRAEICGFVMTSRLSGSAGMIPQISVRPAYQGRGLGRDLVLRILERLKAQAFSTVSLTVTKKNRRAFEWYERLGFRIRKEFGAYVWERAAEGASA